MTEAEVIKHAKAIKQWYSESQCSRCCFGENSACTLTDDAPHTWGFPKGKTFAEVFLEKFPNAKLTDGKTIILCLKRVFGDRAVKCDRGFNNKLCTQCWNEIAPEEYQKK